MRRASSIHHPTSGNIRKHNALPQFILEATTFSSEHPDALEEAECRNSKSCCGVNISRFTRRAVDNFLGFTAPDPLKLTRLVMQNLMLCARFSEIQPGSTSNRVTVFQPHAYLWSTLSGSIILKMSMMTISSLPCKNEIRHQVPSAPVR